MKAVSRYKQVRITLTEERAWNKPHLRNVSVRVMVKPLEAEWTMRHTVLVTRAEDQPPLETLDAVYEALLEVLSNPPLPESH